MQTIQIISSTAILFGLILIVFSKKFAAVSEWSHKHGLSDVGSLGGFWRYLTPRRPHGPKFYKVIGLIFITATVLFNAAMLVAQTYPV